ncbi:MAG: hypothetical protein U5N86_09915 [Planctomycetota bacterium]|nr:hypothetical protein [Planctomycetota bacterium]
MKYISRPLAILAFIAATILPLAVILISVFYRDGEFVISESLESLQSKRIALVTLTNVGLALAATVLSAALAIPAAWLSSRTNTPFAKWFLYVAAVPLLIPSHTVAYAWMQFMEVIGKVIHGFGGPSSSALLQHAVLRVSARSVFLPQ